MLCQACGQSVEAALDGDHAGVFLPLARRIRDLFVKARAIKFVDWLVSWTEDLDETIWWGEQFARAASSHPRFTELAWLAGFAESGKDLLVSILQDRENNKQSI